MPKNDRNPGGPIDVQGNKNGSKSSFKEFSKDQNRSDKSNGNLGSTSQPSVKSDKDTSSTD
jgi:hypothetical protein